MKNIDKTINRTANTNCPACKDIRQHKVEEWKLYHPIFNDFFNERYMRVAGTGFSKEHGTPKPKE